MKAVTAATQPASIWEGQGKKGDLLALRKRKVEKKDALVLLQTKPEKVQIGQLVLDSVALPEAKCVEIMQTIGELYLSGELKKRTSKQRRKR